MKRFLLNIIKFVLFGSIFYILVIPLWEHFIPHPFKSNLLYDPPTGMLNQRLKDLKNTENVDILFLGSSKAYRGFDPRIYKKKGLKVFNLGSSAQTHIQTNFLLKEYFDQLNPKLVVYEVYPDIFMSDGIESGVDIVSSAEKLNFDLLQQVWTLNDIRIYNTLIIKEVNSIFSSHHLKNEPLSKSVKDQYIKGGYVERTPDIVPKIEPIEDHYWKPQEDQVHFFDENLALITEKGVDVVLVFTPFTHQYLNHKKVQEYFSEKGILLDYNEIGNFSLEDHFYDQHHLNQSGVNKLNNNLVKRLEVILKKEAD